MISAPTNVTFGSSAVSSQKVRDLFALKVLNKDGYIALMLAMEPLIDGQVKIDTISFAESISFTETPLNGVKEKEFLITEDDIQATLISLSKKGALFTERPVQMKLSLQYLSMSLTPR